MEVDTRPTEAAPAEINLRPINCELNALTRSDGSALFAQGNTCVLAALSGPVEVKMQNLLIEKAYVECIFRPKSGIPTIKDKLREGLIRDTCETALLTALHPRTMISVQVQELDDRCGLEACAINAACMALLIGGVPMKFTIAAVHCIIDKDGKLVLDPDHLEEIGSLASFLFVFDSLDKNLVTINTRGHFAMLQFNEAHLMCRSASEIIFKFYRKIITKFHNKCANVPVVKAATSEVESSSLKQQVKSVPMEA